MESNIVVKFKKEGIQSKTNEALILKALATQDNFLNQFTYRSIVTDEMLLAQKKTNMVNFENLIGICYVQGLDKMSLDEKQSLAKKIDRYDFVEYAYVEIQVEMKLPLDYKIPNKDKFINKASDEIPDFIDRQTYKDGIEDDHIGIDIEYAWSIGVKGEGIQIADIENNFNPNHINLKRNSIINLLPNLHGDNPDHGTAVAGILYADDLGFGVKGMVHGADAYYFVSQSPQGRVGGIAKGLEVLNAGDVFVYEMQTSGPNLEYVPVDYEYGVWDVTQEALKAGIIVVAAAGNGNEDLDGEDYDEYRERGDYGIIRVGAGDQRLNKADFSTYGSIIHLQGWGTWNVTTTGYGDLYDDGSNNYTARFSGTSSATPIVASAVATVQSWYKQKTGEVLTPFQMRNLLVRTGILQKDPEKGHIGPIPNVRNAINELHKIFLSTVRAVIEGPEIVYEKQSIILSAEKSKSNVADIISYKWKLPEGIIADRLDSPKITFLAPKLIKSQKFLVTVTVTDALGNCENTTHTLVVFTLAKAIIDGPKVGYSNRKVTLSAEGSKSKVADIVSYKWQLPEGITADRLDQSTLTFIVPELTKSQKFLINVTVTDALGNSNSGTHAIVAFIAPLSWNPEKIYIENDMVSWKNKIWIAKLANKGIEPGTDHTIWEELAF